LFFFNQANLRGVLDKIKRQQEDLKSASVNEARLKARCEELEKNLEEAKEKVRFFDVVDFFPHS